MSAIGNRYILHDRLGMGGMGVVYRATDRLTGQVVALKQVTKAIEDFQSKRGAALRLALAQEFKVLAGLRHPHIISVLDYGFDESGQPYFTMDYLENAQTILEAGSNQGIKIQVRLLIQVFQALMYLHRRGVLHRDLKPGNVLVVNGQAKLLDFGLSLWEESPDSDEVTGTLAYMSPEVLRGKPATQSTDMFSMGVIAYELFAGSLPYTFDSIDSLMDEILYTHPDLEKLDLPAGLESTLKRLLAKSAEARYGDAAEVIAALNAAVGFQQQTETAEIRDSFLQAARFVGRESEFKLLSSALEKIVSGVGHIPTSEPFGSAWLIGGESGVGKSRLIDELRALALVKGAHVLRGQAASEGGGPYFQWRDVLRRLVLIVEMSREDASVLKTVVPDIGDLLGQTVPDALELEPGPAQSRLLGVLSTLFRRLRLPTMIILEDTHWAGTESLAVLNQLNQIIADLPIMVVASFRDDEQPDLPARFPSMRLVHLDRLTVEEIAELSESMLGAGGSQPQVIDLLRKETEGNVFFLVEVVRALAEEAGELERIASMTLPNQVAAGGIQQIVQRRLERVPERWHLLLNLAAVGGRQIDMDVLREAIAASHETMLQPNDLDKGLNFCINAAVLEVDDGYWRFAHDKLREGILSGLPEAESGTLHRRIAEAIERVYPGDSNQYSVLAFHWGLAGDSAKSTHYGMMAGQQALEISAYKEAVAFFERVLADAGSDDLRKALLKRQLASAYWGLSRYADAGQLYEESLGLFRAANSGDGMAECLKGLGDVARRKGDYAGAKAYFAQTLDLCRAANNAIATGLALVRMGVIERILGNYEVARNYYLDGLRIFETAGEHVRMATIQSGLGLLASDEGRFDEAQGYMEASLEIARKVHNPNGTALVLTGLAWVSYLQGDHEAARAYTIESLALSREVGDRWMIANNLGNLGKIVTQLGDYSAALRHFQEALRISTEIGAVPLTLEILPGVAQVYKQEGEGEYAVQLLALALNHPASYSEVKSQAQPLLTQLECELAAERFAAALLKSQNTELNTVIMEILDDAL